MYKAKILLIIYILSINSYSYTFGEFADDISAPLQKSDSQEILIWGGSIALLLSSQRENFVDPLSKKYGEEERPMGDLAIFGDYMGQLVPNLTYLSYQYFQDTSLASHRFTYMFKTTLYTGLTTGILKRIFNERRPHKGDRLSFPSGHTSTAFAFAGVIHYEYQDKLYSSLAYSMATIVGLSRINDNAHYLHDVVFGASLGMAYACAFQNDNSQWVLSPINGGLMYSYLY